MCGIRGFIVVSHYPSSESYSPPSSPSHFSAPSFQPLHQHRFASPPPLYPASHPFAQTPAAPDPVPSSSSSPQTISPQTPKSKPEIQTTRPWRRFPSRGPKKSVGRRGVGDEYRLGFELACVAVEEEGVLRERCRRKEDRLLSRWRGPLFDFLCMIKSPEMGDAS